jgi:hypothetical protein
MFIYFSNYLKTAFTILGAWSESTTNENMYDLMLQQLIFRGFEYSKNTLINFDDKNYTYLPTHLQNGVMFWDKQ